MGPAARPKDDAAWYHRLRRLRVRLALGVGVLTVGAALYSLLSKTAFTIDPGSGTPVGLSVRTDRHIATLIRTLEPYTPSPDRDHGKDTYRYSLFLVPLDGSGPELIPIGGGYPASTSGRAKILGSDGRVLWFDLDGAGGVDLERKAALAPADGREPALPRPASPFPPSPDRHLSAGFITGAGQWLGLHSEEEIRGEFAPKTFVRRVAPQASRKQMRRFYRGTLDAPVDDTYHRILSMAPIREAGYFNAAFLRFDEAAEPLRLSNPEGALMLHTSGPGSDGTAVIARVDLEGNVLWSVDTAIDRFALSQILPGEYVFAFVGTRPPVPGKVSEPLLVIIANATGGATTRSLWR